jgi:hypothetical protein
VSIRESAYQFATELVLAGEVIDFRGGVFAFGARGKRSIYLEVADYGFWGGTGTRIGVSHIRRHMWLLDCLTFNPPPAGLASGRQVSCFVGLSQQIQNVFKVLPRNNLYSAFKTPPILTHVNGKFLRVYKAKLLFLE